MRLTGPISAVSISTCSLRCALSACRTKRSSRTTPVPASLVERRIEPRQDAAPALGRDPHDRVGRDAELLHQRGVEPDRQPRAVAEFVGEMIDAGVDVRAPAMCVAVVVMMRTVVHVFVF